MLDVWPGSEYTTGSTLWNISPLTRWLSMTNILVVIRRIYHYQLKCYYLKNQKLFLYFIAFSESALSFEHFEKKQLASYLNYFWSYWLRKTCLFKCRKSLVSASPLAVNLWSANPTKWSDTPNNSSMNCVCLTILWGWRFKGQKINSEFEIH